MEGPANRNIPDSRYPEWLPTYEAALLELDPAKLKERVKAAHAAINRRMKAMAQDHGGGDQHELQAIADALSGLAMLEREAADGHSG